MKFSKIVVLVALVPTTAAFSVETANQRFFSRPQLRTNTGLRMSLEDLESKLLNESPSPTPKPASKPSPVVKPAPKPTPEPLQKAIAPKPEPKPKPAPVPRKPVETPKVTTVIPKPSVPKAAPKPVPVPKPTPKSVATTENTLLPGVALGAAPLALGGLAALAAARSTLSTTLERREKIQKELAEQARIKAEREARKKQAEIDGTGLASSLVCILWNVTLYLKLPQSLMLTIVP